MIGAPDIALVWDFEGVLGPGYLSTLLTRFAVEEEAFWRSVDVDQHRDQLQTEQREVLPSDILSAVKVGLFPGLSNSALFELGSEIPLYEGTLELFDELNLKIERSIGRRGQRVTLEQHIFSNFPERVLKGSRVAPYVDKISATEFLESSTDAGVDGIKSQLHSGDRARLLLEIGARISSWNVIFISGPKDVEAFETLKRHGGRTFAVYRPASENGFQAAKKLRDIGLVDEIGEARYARGAPTSLWLLDALSEMASYSLEIGSVPRVSEGDVGVDRPGVKVLTTFRANPEPMSLSSGVDSHALRLKFEEACRSFLGSAFEKHKPVLDVWYGCNTGSLHPPDLSRFVAELEQSASRTPTGRQRRSAAVRNSDFETLLNFLDNLCRKYKRQ